tara:strand:- start:19738 stop:20988 length:1251 start_codon:yes stop_codon:yes gene_type:complete
MKLEKSLCYVNLSDDLHRFSRINKELIQHLSISFNKIYILNFHSLRIFSKKKKISIKKNKIFLPKNFIIINIKSSKDLLKFSRNKKLLVIINDITKSIMDFKIYYLLKKINAKLIMISITSMYGSKIFVDIPIKDLVKGYRHFFLKGFYYIWRILTIVNMFPKIDLLLESNAENIKAFNNGISRKFEKFFPFFKISLYRKIVHVNSSVFDTFYRNKNKKNNTKKNGKYILYIDSPFASPDRISREGKLNLHDKQKFYKNLFIALNNISSTFKKKIIISLHPSTIKSFSKSTKIFKTNNNIVVSKKRTVDLVNNSSIVLFTVSSAVLNAVILKKKIISLKTKYLGKHNLKLNEKNTNGIRCPLIDIDKKISISKKKMNLKFKKAISHYDDFINRRLINKSNKPSYIEIVETIKKQKF